jgi:hypothetical protein
VWQLKDLSVKAVRHLLFASAVSLLCFSSSWASPLLPSTVQIPAAAEDEPGAGGSVLAETTSDFSIPGSLSGSLTTRVISGDPTNELGGLTFTFELHNDGVEGSNSIGRLSLPGYTAFTVDASYNSAGGLAPASIDRAPGGDVVGFNFVPTPADPLAGFLAPGITSSVLVVQTDATDYVAGLAGLIDGGVTTADTFQPVPEPAGLALLAACGLALSCLGARRRRSA